MAFSLYDATVPQYLQILPCMAGLIDKAEAWCQEKGLPQSALIDARLAPDMFTFAYQARLTALHSAGAVKALAAGIFRVDPSPPPATFAELRALVTGAIADLQGVSAAEMNSHADRDVAFEYAGKLMMTFTGTNYLLSFAQPNFHFHGSMLYAILRNQGLEIGKRDYLGAVKATQPA